MMVGAEEVEPEQRQLCQHAALLGDPAGQDEVERRDAVGRDDQISIAEIVEVTDLAPPDKIQTRKLGLTDDLRSAFCCSHGTSPYRCFS